MVILALELDLSSPDASSLDVHKVLINVIALNHRLSAHTQNLQMAKHWVLFTPFGFIEQDSLRAEHQIFHSGVRAVVQLSLLLLEWLRALTMDQFLCRYVLFDAKLKISIHIYFLCPDRFGQGFPVMNLSSTKVTGNWKYTIYRIIVAWNVLLISTLL